MKKTILVAMCLSILSSSAWALGDAEKGKEKSQVCAACHNADGNSTNVLYPKLAGQRADYLLHALKSYKDGSRIDPIMKGMTAALSEEDMENLAGYFSGQKSDLTILPK